MDPIAALAAEHDDMLRAAKSTGLSTRAFAVYWNLKDDPALLGGNI